MDFKRLLTVMAVFAVATPALAEESDISAAAAEQTRSGLSGIVGFSFADARGNSDTSAITGQSTLKYVTRSPWLYDAKMQFVARQQDEVATEERYEARLTANYYWSPDDYLFGRLDWRKDNFGGVREEWVPSAGFGRVLLRTERHDLRGEIGAGYRIADLNDGTREKGAAASGGIRYKWKVSATAEIFQNALVQWSDDNTYLESETGLRTSIIRNISAKISYLVKRNTVVPEGRANSDYFTTIGLEYAFKP